MNLLRKRDWKPKQRALMVRVQHEMLDDAAVEGVWVGTYAGGRYLHLRAARTVTAGDPRPFRHDELLIPADRVIYLEVLGADEGAGAAIKEPGA